MAKIADLRSEGRQELIWSRELPGLALNLAADGVRRHWVVQTRVAGKMRRIKIADFGAPSHEVTERARMFLSKMRSGRDPLKEEQAEVAEEVRKEITLAQLAQQFLDVRGSRLRPRTRETYTKTIRLFSKDWLPRPISSLKPDEVARRYETLCSEKSVGTAQTWISGVRSLLNFAVDAELLARNPCDILKKQRLYRDAEPRTRVIARSELPVVVYALERMRKTERFPWAHVLELGLLSLMRRSELAGLRWSWVEGDLIHIPAEVAKSRRARIIPLTTRMHGILDEARKVTEEVDDRCPWLASDDRVFFSQPERLRPEKKELQGWSHALGLLEKGTTEVLEDGTVVPGVRISMHDLRRSSSSLLAAIGVPDLIRKSILGHSLGDATDRAYLVPEVEDLRRALEKLDEAMREAI